MFKALLLCSFIVATAASVQAGYDQLLRALDSYVQNSYGQLANSSSPELRQTGQEITQNYTAYRVGY